MLKILPSLPEMSIYLCHFALLATPFCLIRGSRRTLHSAAPGQEEHWGTLTVRLICLALGVIYLTFQLYMLALCHHPPGHVATGCQSNSLPSPVLWHAKKMSNLWSWHLCPFFSFSPAYPRTVSNFLPCCHTYWAHPFVLRFLRDKRRIKLPVFYFWQEFQSPFLSRVLWTH